MVDNIRIILATILIVVFVSSIAESRSSGLTQLAFALSSLTVTPSSAYPNSVITLEGSGFSVGTGYVFFDINHGNDGLLAPGDPFQIITTTDGSFTTTLTVPDVNPADYNQPRAYIRADFPPLGSPPGASLDKNVAFIVLAPPLISINDVSKLEGNNGVTNFVFTVSSNTPPVTPVTVDYATVDGTATITDNDYNSNSGTLTLTSTNPSQTIIVSVIGDTKVESDETFFINLSNPTGAVISDGQAVGTILNDDVLTNAPPSVNAGPDQTITLPNSATLSGTVVDDGLPAGSTLTMSWSKVNGLGSVTFSNPNGALTDATFSAPGTYTLRLSASDTSVISSDDVIITVNPLTPPPVIDTDGDGVPDNSDLCPTVPASTPDGCPVVTDTDHDGIPDTYDQCPSDPNKAFPGTQGCGNSDTAPLEQQIATLNDQIASLQIDSDSDGVPDLFDQCPTDPLKTIGGVNGCGSPEPDFGQIISSLQNTISNLNEQILNLQGQLTTANPVYCGIPRNSWPVVISGTPDDDKIIGTKNDDLILGYDGNNKIYGNGGDDCIIVGNGNNIIIGGRGNDTIITGNGDNRIHAGQGNNHIVTGNGNDVIFVGNGNNFIDAGNGLNKCKIGSGNNQVINCKEDKKMKEEEFTTDSEDKQYIDYTDEQIKFKKDDEKNKQNEHEILKKPK